MSTVACQGCGMPRAAELVGVAECPVCGHVVSPEPAFDPIPPAVILPKKVPAPPPAPKPTPSHTGGAVAGVIGFVAGAAVGIVGLLAWQGRFAPATPESTLARRAGEEPVSSSPAPAGQPEVAPEPRGVSSFSPEPAIPTSQTPVPVPTPDGKAVVVELDEPDGVYTVPVRNGERVILKGKVGTLKIGSVEAGATVDATELTAAAITVSGKIDGASVVKLNAPGGTVSVAGAIDGGAKVGITARHVWLGSVVGGTGTRVQVVLGRSGGLKVAGVQGTAVVEYHAASSGWSEPDISVGAVARGATFRRVEVK